MGIHRTFNLQPSTFNLLIALFIAAAFLPQTPIRATAGPCCWIEELDPAQDGIDSLEFIEISGPAGAALDGFRLVLFSGGSATFASYRILRLDGYRIGSHGRFVVGSARVANVDLVGWDTDGLQNAGNEPDAVALYQYDAEPVAPSPTSLVDVVVYGNKDLAAFRTGFRADAPPPLIPLDSTTTAIGRSPGGGLTSTLIPSPGLANHGLRFNEVDVVTGGGNGSIELVGAPGSSIAGYSLVAFGGDGAILWSEPLTGTLANGGSLPGGIVLSFPPGRLPIADGQPRALALYSGTVPITVTATGLADVVVYGTSDAGWRLDFDGYPPLLQPDDPASTIGRFAGVTGPAARFGPTTPTIGGVNSAPAGVLTPISRVQGAVLESDDGRQHTSPYSGRSVTVTGVVVGLTRSGSFYTCWLQGESDGDPRTSDALAVALGTTPLLAGHRPAPGDWITVTGMVAEPILMTTLTGLTSVEIGPNGPLPAPLILDPNSLADVGASARFWERVEGMRVGLPAGGFVVGPRTRSTIGETEIVILPGDHPVVLRSDPGDRRIFRAGHLLNNPGAEHARILLTALRLRAENSSATLPAARLGDRFPSPISGIATGDPQHAIAVEALTPADPGPIPGSDLTEPDRQRQFSIATWNLENLFDRINDPFDSEDNPGAPYVPISSQRYSDKLTKIARITLERLHAPDLLVVQEAEDQDLCTGGGALTGQCGTVDNADGLPDVLQDLVATIATRTEGAIRYQPALSRRGADGRGIVSAFLYRTDRVRLLPPLPTDPVLGERTADPDRLAFPENGQVVSPKALNTTAAPEVAIDAEGGALFSRSPQVARFRIGRNGPDDPFGATLTVIAVHLKSDPSAFRPRRLVQSSYLAALTGELLRADPNASVLVAGDFNDVDGSASLRPLFDDLAISQVPLTVLDRQVPANNRYSFVFGGLAQDIDHLVASPALADRLDTVRYLHLNADWPDATAIDATTLYRASDHDPLIARFRFELVRYRIFVP